MVKTKSCKVSLDNESSVKGSATRDDEGYPPKQVVLNLIKKEIGGGNIFLPSTV